MPVETAEQVFSHAVHLHQAGRLSEAEQRYREILARDQRHADALHMLGIMGLQVGNFDAAITLISKAIEADSSVATFHVNLGIALQLTGRLGDAIGAFRSAIVLRSDFAGAYQGLGAAFAGLGRLAEAIDAYQSAVRYQPDHAEARSNLGLALAAAGRLAEAVDAYRTAICFRPDLAEIQSNLGSALRDLGDAGRAVELCRRAVSGRPDLSDAHYNGSLALKDIDRFNESADACRKAISLRPDFAPAHTNLAGVLFAMGHPAEAAAACARAIHAQPLDADAHSNYGSALIELGRSKEAAAAFGAALCAKPAHVDALSNLGGDLVGQGFTRAASKLLDRARTCRPAEFRTAFAAATLLPIIPSSLADIDLWRRAYLEGITRLMDAPGELDNPLTVNSHSFELAYHGLNNRRFMETLNRLFRLKSPVLSFSTPNAGSANARNGARIRVGFISEFLSHHTVGKLFQGFICQLDRSIFDVVLVHAPKARQDEFGARLARAADSTLILKGTLQDQQKLIADQRLDVLFFPDIGMSAATYFLAFGRLAPVQATSWGHPDTSGLDTIDYFLSSEMIETAEADDHYTERLVRLRRLPCYYVPLMPPQETSARADFGLPSRGTLYGCPQSLFKLHPEFDGVLAAIAEGDPTGHIIMLESGVPAWEQLLKERWRRTHPILERRVKFLPRQPQHRFLGLMSHFDVLLDPIHFGSGNTLYDAMLFGTPIVTRPGEFMRGRIVAGAYRQMGVDDAPVIADIEAYAPMALALGEDVKRRTKIRNSTLARAGELYADRAALHAFENFLKASVAAAERGERLPIGWRS